MRAYYPDRIDEPHPRRILCPSPLDSITDDLALLPEGSPERLTALGTLRNIRRLLARSEFAPN
jgi:hypothetical protein